MLWLHIEIELSRDLNLRVMSESTHRDPYLILQHLL